MKRAVNLICSLDLLFILLLAVSGSVGDPLISEAVYYIAFILPIALGSIYIRRERPYTENERSVYLRCGKDELLYSLPLIIPTVIAIMAVSFVGSSLMELFGLVRETEVEGNIIYALILYALFPAVLEEFLFRFIPLKLLLPYSRPCAVFISALFFALVHADLFVIPYALVAGFIFALVDIRCESVLPSIIMHLTNNMISVLLIKSVSSAMTIAVYVTVGVLGALSAVFIAIRRKSYRDLFSPAFEREEKQPIGYAPAIMLVLCLTLAITSLIG